MQDEQDARVSSPELASWNRNGAVQFWAGVRSWTETVQTLSTKRQIVALAAAAALSFPAFAAVAQNQDEDARRQPADRAELAKGEQKAFGGLNAPNARLAGLFNAGGSPVRTKGVDSIERVDTGVYCIRPAASANINVSKSLISLTVEFSFSDVTEAMAQWAEGLSGCGNGRFGVYTFADPNNDGNYSFSNDVAFSIVVP